MSVTTTLAYVSNADSHDISVVALDLASHAWNVVQTIAVGGMAMPLTLSPDRRWLHVAIRTLPYRVVTLSIDARTGHLTPVSEAPLVDSMASISIDKTGRWLLAASYPGSVVSVSAITPSGVIGDTVQVIADIKNAHAIRLDSANTCATACALGDDSVYSWKFDDVRGRLDTSEVLVTRIGANAGPRHFVWNAAGTCLYVLCELDGLIHRYHVAPDRRTLNFRQRISTLPASFSGQPSAADIHLSPDGRFLYASERRTSTLSVFVVDPLSGELTFREQVATEPVPRGFALDETGSWLLAAGLDSGTLACFQVDPRDGTLTQVAAVTVGKGPNWVEIVSHKTTS